MNKKIFVALLALSFIIPGYSQEDAKETKKETTGEEKITEKIGDKVYYEVTLEDFEQTKYDDKNIKFRVTKDQKAALTTRDQYPAPIEKSKKYLGFKMYAKKGDFFVIKPTKDIVIEKYCRSISVWVYGKRFSGELSLLIQDAENKIHRLRLGTLDFLGWRKMIIKLDRRIKQEDEFLNQKKFLKILQIQYRPGNMTIHPRWQYFYIDDITAMVREKYTDRQTDDW